MSANCQQPAPHRRREMFLVRFVRCGITATWRPSRSAALLVFVALTPLVVGCGGEPPLNDEGKQRLRDAEEREKKFEEEAARKLEARKKRSADEILGDDATPKNGAGSKSGAPVNSGTDGPAPNAKRADLPALPDEQPPKSDRSTKKPADDASTSDEPHREAAPNRNGHASTPKPSRPFDPLNPKPVTPSAVDGDSVITLDDPPPPPRNGKASPATKSPPSNSTAPKTPAKSPTGTVPRGEPGVLDSGDSPTTNGKAAGNQGTTMASAAAWRRIRGGMPAAEVKKLLGPPTGASNDAYVLYWYYGAGESAGKVAFIGPSQQAIAWDAPLK